MGKEDCKHPKNVIRTINNGGSYCGICLETNLYNKVVKNEDGNEVFKGTVWECDEWIKNNTKKDKPKWFYLWKLLTMEMNPVLGWIFALILLPFFTLGFAILIIKNNQ